MEEYTRPLNERDKKIIAEMKIAEKLQKEEGCKLLDCNVVTNNINLRIEIIDLKKEMREQEKIIELMADKIYKTTDTLNMLDIGKEINYDLEKLFNGIDETEALKIIIDYFKKKARE